MFLIKAAMPSKLIKIINLPHIWILNLSLSETNSSLLSVSRVSVVRRVPSRPAGRRSASLTFLHANMQLAWSYQAKNLPLLSSTYNLLSSSTLLRRVVTWRGEWKRTTRRVQIWRRSAGRHLRTPASKTTHGCYGFMVS